MTEATDTGGADIQVVARCAQVVRMFSFENRTVRVTQVASELGVGRTTAHRYLASLANAGFLERDGDRGYSLGPLLAHVGTLALNGFGVVEIADPYLRDLADVAEETAVLSVWAGRSPVVVRCHEPENRVLNISIRVGRTLNLDAAQAAVFLAYRTDRVDPLLDQLDEPQAERIRRRIDDVRRSGVAISDTINVGVRVIAAPVLDHEGMVVATVAIIGTVHTLSSDLNAGKVLALRDTADRLSSALGFTP
ncbi:IclR family transcriptional regulator [Pseudonocardia sp. MH-G8]|uniref:IclR family transcriptional regulator n=1 Tax=Pseudonocardia sp. MH-G8 TaxID=1854588 RepID=UPI000BA132D9|nr:IclR family transcriptional regulator [Pseudonocardia sp. MH-G8]OZM75814.1 transcriptional regulator [Pseudonocardia sp. MH-G8]